MLGPHRDVRHAPSWAMSSQPRVIPASQQVRRVLPLWYLQLLPPGVLEARPFWWLSRMK